jgi:hypothetical protein
LGLRETRQQGSGEDYVTSSSYFSPNIIRVISKIIIRWAAHVARMVGRRGACRVLVGGSDGKNHLEEVGIDGRIILKWIFKKWNGRHGSGSGQGEVAAASECGNELRIP